MTTKEELRDRLFGSLIGFQATWVANIGLTAGLFQAIADSGDGITEAVLSARLGYEPRYVRVWCRAAYAFEWVEYDEATGYYMTSEMRALLLDPSDPLYVGGRILFTAALSEDFLAFPDRLADGAIFPREDHHPDLLAALTQMSKPDFQIMTEIVLPQEASALKARLDAGGDILDVGCGGGYGVAHFARRFPNARVIGLEVNPGMLELARKTMAEASLADRASIRPVDVREIEFDAAFDLIYLNISLHETGGPDDYRNVLQRCRRALRDGGSLLISELPYPGTIQEYRTAPAYRMLAGVQHHEMLVGCGMITIPELQRLLTDAGYRNVRRCRQPSPTRVMYLAER